MPVRKQILLDTTRAKLLKKFASEIQDSESEVIRRALDSFDPLRESPREELRLLLCALRDANQRVRAALARAERELTV